MKRDDRGQTSGTPLDHSRKHADHQPLSRDCGSHVFQRPQPPHFHAVYNEDEVLIEIAGQQVYQGNLPRRQLQMVQQWAGLHFQELQADWRLAQTGQSLKPIDPLP